jgi:hypothetical protein
MHAQLSWLVHCLLSAYNALDDECIRPKIIRPSPCYVAITPPWPCHGYTCGFFLLLHSRTLNSIWRVGELAVHPNPQNDASQHNSEAILAVRLLLWFSENIDHIHPLMPVWTSCGWSPVKHKSGASTIVFAPSYYPFQGQLGVMTKFSQNCIFHLIYMNACLNGNYLPAFKKSGEILFYRSPSVRPKVTSPRPLNGSNWNCLMRCVRHSSTNVHNTLRISIQLGLFPPGGDMWKHIFAHYSISTCGKATKCCVLVHL